MLNGAVPRAVPGHGVPAQPCAPQLAAALAAWQVPPSLQPHRSIRPTRCAPPAAAMTSPMTHMSARHVPGATALKLDPFVTVAKCAPKWWQASTPGRATSRSRMAPATPWPPTLGRFGAQHVAVLSYLVVFTAPMASPAPKRATTPNASRAPQPGAVQHPASAAAPTPACCICSGAAAQRARARIVAASWRANGVPHS